MKRPIETMEMAGEAPTTETRATAGRGRCRCGLESLGLEVNARKLIKGRGRRTTTTLLGRGCS
jgi:hypothetical protein